MKRKYLPVLLLIGVIIAGAYGCGGGGGGGGDVTVAPPQVQLNAASQVCVRCHAAAATSYALSLHNTENQATCSQCHTGADAHAASGGTVAVASTNPDASTGPGLNTRINNICTGCHTTLTAAHDNKNIVITGDTRNLFVSEEPAQYVDMANNQPQKQRCTGCHNPHDTTSRMNLFKDYASSGHGDLNGLAWAHYRWKLAPGITPVGTYTAAGVVANNSERSQCQRCHTATSFVAQVNGDRTGSTQGASLTTPYTGKFSGATSPSVLDVSSALTAVTAATGNPVTAGYRYYFAVFDASGSTTRDNTKQVLRCDACHSDNTYTVRTASAVTPEYKDSSLNVYQQVSGGVTNTYLEASLKRTAAGALVLDGSNNATIVLPDVGKSNLCLYCHVGRVNGWAIKTEPRPFTNLSFVNSHYHPAGGILYRTIGYKYDDVSANLTYDNGTFRHKQVGSAADYPTTGSGGPCVGCHMNPARHTFSPVEKDATTGAILRITSPTCGSVTSACHSTATFASDVDTERVNFQAALYALQRQLENVAGTGNGYYYSSTYPYFYTTAAYATAVTNWVTTGDLTLTTGKPNMGAAFNFNVLKRGEGSYTHNRRYTRRLLWDSINWIYDNNLNNLDVGTAIDALATAGKITENQRVNARTYLCTNTAVGSACARP